VSPATVTAAVRHEFDTAAGPAWADLERPARPRGLLILGHGAGGGIEAPDLLAARDGALAAGLAVARVTQAYRVAGRKAPAPAARLDEVWLSVAGQLRALRGLRTVPLVAGGRSSGARVACRTADAVGATGVVALAFPLHPPGKADRPEASRLAELARPGVPVLVVQGDRDPFGRPGAAAGRLVQLLPGADHSLKKGLDLLSIAVRSFLEGLLS
jgi:predicted alpha/beta-hydrolase family hydrolase